jgi:hypothetical protein
MARKPKATDQDADPALTVTEPVDNDLMAVVDATDPLRPAEAETAAPAEPVAEPAPEPTPPPAAKPAEPAPVVTQKSSGLPLLLGFVLGALIAAAAGVATLRYAPDYLALPSADLSGMEAALGDQQAAMAALQARVEELSAAPATDPAIADRLAQLESATPPDVTVLSDRLDELAARLDALPSAPAVGGADPAELQALRDQIAALQSGTAVSEQATALAAEAEQRLAEARDAAAALAAETQAATAAALRQAALGRVAAAVETGAPYASALAELGEVPPALADHATTGVPSLARLQDRFPAAARRALEAALTADMGASWTDRVTNFLRSQTGARSLTPREGNDPDAILSRAEAALASGDLTAALAEIATLPEAAKNAMADWTAEADQRQQAVQALAALAQQG